MPRLDSFTTKTETQTFDIGGETVKITYTPSRITGRDIERLDQIENDGNLDALYGMVRKSIVEWDVTGPIEVDGETVVAEGEPIPFTDAALQHVPIDFLGAVLACVQDASVKGPNPTRAKGRSRK